MHYNQRLQDVMVLSDHSYQVKIQIPSKSTSDDDKITITFKKLAGSEDEDPIGRFEDSLGSFKVQGQSKVGKRWIPFGN